MNGAVAPSWGSEAVYAVGCAAKPAPWANRCVHTQAHRHTDRHTDWHAHMDKHMDKHMHTHMHTYIHTYMDKRAQPRAATARRGWAGAGLAWPMP